MTKHPMQPLEWVDDVIRFKQNKIVRFLLDAGLYDMNLLSMMPFDREDYEQFAQLIGYSVSGFGDLSYADPKVVDDADKQAANLIKGEPE